MDGNTSLTRRISRPNRVFAALLVTGLAVGLTVGACTPRVDLRGHVPNPEALAEIEKGRHTRDQVAEMLGTPSSIGTFEDDRWYYVTRKTETLAFYDAELVEQRVVIVEFDEAGFVKDVTTHGAENAREIELVERETPTKGREFGFFEQILGNVGAPIGAGQ